MAERLGLSEESESEQCEEDFALQIGLNGLQLMEVGPGASGPVRVDFVEGVLAHRRQFGGGQGQMIAKAVGIQPGIRPRVLDATAGLGRDAFVLASLGCDVFLIERHAIVAALLEDALIRANQDEEVREISGRMQLLGGDAVELMQAWSGLPPEVVYLDPMFPHRDKSALVKKEMRLFRLLVGDDNDASALLEVAEGLASHRVVVKRPRKAPVLAGRKPTFCLEGKANRFDIYVKKSFRAV
ncbi:class I SAM-dependent methyltransferase [Propionivibrio limicola]|uniref:class I SAM-dependent methyltransferase n=1 Tax=Propionivibrio limicola TaxID=167645 RepID=UPI001B88189C|nr:class I SAM-dependent methyltransferase [Propionivibrio limicola]